jgi:hypothetical protein
MKIYESNSYENKCRANTNSPYENPPGTALKSTKKNKFIIFKN